MDTLIKMVGTLSNKINVLESIINNKSPESKLSQNYFIKELVVKINKNNATTKTINQKRTT